MALIALPSAGIRSVKWRQNTPAEITRSEWTGKTQALLGAPSRWTAHVEINATGDITVVRAWRAFFALLRGQVNSFELPATEGEQSGVGLATCLIGSGWSGNVISGGGWPLVVNPNLMPAGSIISYSGHLFTLTAAARTPSTDGFATFNIEPALTPPANGIDYAYLRAPVGTMRLAGPVTGIDADPGSYTPISFDCEEAW